MTTDLLAQNLARRQLGMVTRSQLREAGIDHRVIGRRLASGAWRAPFPTVIDVGTHAPSWDRSVLAAVLAAGDGALASHATAAHLHGMLDIDRPATIDITVLRGGRTRAGALALHTTVYLDLEDVGSVGSVPATSRLRTILDLAPQLDQGHLELLVGDEVRGRPGARERLETLARRRPGWAGSSQVLRTLARTGPSIELTESPLEVRGLSCFRRGGLPEPEVQPTLRDADGEFLARPDALWREARVIVEFVGRRFHDTPSRRTLDGARRRRLEVEGWVVVEVHREDLDGERATQLVARLRVLLGV